MLKYLLKIRSWLTSIYDQRYRGTVLSLKLARLWPKNHKGEPPAEHMTAEEAATAYREGRLGYIIVQIDGLSGADMQHAIRTGFMPALKKLMRSGDYGLQSWYPGLPSDTPGIQMGLMYGDSSDVLGFYWRDRETDSPISCANPAHVRKLEQTIAARRRGILEGGSSYANVISGGASRAVLTMSELRPRSPGFLKAVLKWSTLFVSNPIQLLIMPFLIIWEFMQELLDRTLVELQNKPHLQTEGWFPLARLFMNLFCREIVTMGIQLDILSGTPIIYANYVGYDLVGHHSGPRSINAMLVLRGIDHQLRQINRLRTVGQRHYKLIVLSDHGMNPSIPFPETYNQSLQDYVRQVIQNPSTADCCPDKTSLWARFVAFMGRRFRGGPRSEQGGSHNDNDEIYAIASSPIAHVYLGLNKYALTLEQIEERHPRAVETLLLHPGIGTVLAQSERGIAVVGKHGRVLLDTNGNIQEVIGQNPLDELDEEAKARNQIVKLFRWRNCGDLVLFGAYDKQTGVCVSFESQLSAHASLGGRQMDAFILYPRALPEPPSYTESSCDLYPYFAALVGINEEAASDQAEDTDTERISIAV